MQRSHSFVTKIFLFLGLSFGVTSLLCPPGRPVGSRQTDDYGYGYYGRERYVSDEERHLERLKINAQRRKDLGEQRSQEEQRKARLLKTRAFMEKQDSQKNFVDEFKRLYEKKTRRSGISFGSSDDDKTDLVAVLRDWSKKGEVKNKLDADVLTLEGRINRLKTAEEAATRPDARLKLSQELSGLQVELKRIQKLIKFLESASDLEDLKHLMGLDIEEAAAVEIADPELEELKNLVGATNDTANLTEDEKKELKKLVEARGGKFEDLKDGDMTQFRLLKEKKLAEYDKEVKEADVKLKEMENYDSVTNTLFRAFLPDEYDGVSATSTPKKVGLALALPLVSAARKSLDTEYERFTNRMVRAMGDWFHDLAVKAGFASPLTSKQVGSWLKMVQSFEKNMKTLSSQSSGDEKLLEGFDIRNANRPKKTGVDTALVGQDLAAQVNAGGEEVDEAVDFMRNKEPMYVRICDGMVNPLKRQIKTVLHRMKGESYAEQREVMNDIIKMLDCVRYMAHGEYKVYRTLVLTNGLNLEIAACAQWISALLVALKDLVSTTEEAENPSSTSPSSSYGKTSRFGD